MDKLKTWMVEVLIKKIVPKVVSAGLTAFIGVVIAHQELMEKMGVTYYPSFDGHWSGAMPTGRLFTIEIDTLGYFFGGLLILGATAFVAWLMHHGAATVTGAPQSGDKREVPEQPVLGGAREGDPK